MLASFNQLTGPNGIGRLVLQSGKVVTAQTHTAVGKSVGALCEVKSVVNVPVRFPRALTSEQEQCSQFQTPATMTGYLAYCFSIAIQSQVLRLRFEDGRHQRAIDERGAR